MKNFKEQIKENKRQLKVVFDDIQSAVDKGRFISESGISDIGDHGNIAEFSFANWIETKHGRVSYRIFISNDKWFATTTEASSNFLFTEGYPSVNGIYYVEWFDKAWMKPDPLRGAVPGIEFAKYDVYYGMRFYSDEANANIEKVKRCCKRYVKLDV